MQHFTKMQGAGNDYVYIDCKKNIPENPGDLAKKVSERHFGIGSDGLVLILPPLNSENHARMQMFNPNGSEAEMCGNAIRCVARFVRERWNLTAVPLKIETKAGVKIIETRYNEGIFLASVDMGEPVLEGETRLNGKEFVKISMGNPHAVAFVDSVINAPVLTEGPILEVDKEFPKKSNIEFAEFIDAKHIKMRVWERGTGETLACGTGACAAAVAAMLKKNAERILTVELLGGDLVIEWSRETNHVTMIGPAEFVFEGEF